MKLRPTEPLNDLAELGPVGNLSVTSDYDALKTPDTLINDLDVVCGDFIGLATAIVDGDYTKEDLNDFKDAFGSLRELSRLVYDATMETDETA